MIYFDTTYSSVVAVIFMDKLKLVVIGSVQKYTFTTKVGVYLVVLPKSTYTN